LEITTQSLFYHHYTGQPALAGTSSRELDDFIGAKFFCPHALADSIDLKFRKVLDVTCIIHTLFSDRVLCINFDSILFSLGFLAFANDGLFIFVV